MAPQDPRALTPAQRAEHVKRRARDLGFDGVGITHLDPPPHGDALDRWLGTGMAGTMRYMHRQAERRKRPATILEGAIRAVVMTRGYHTPDPPPKPGTGRVAKYARGRDYHTALRSPLETVRNTLIQLGATPRRTRSYVDAGPVPERELAQRAGLGWIGKNTMLLAPERGSYFFLAAILTDLELAPDPPFAADRCGTCTRCLDACPTGAFPEPRVLDATRCISYLTIEHRGDFPPEAPSTGEWLFGCDVCQEVCPWNAKFARAANDPVLAPDPQRATVPLDEFEGMTEPAFADRYGWTALERPGLTGLRRNARAVRAHVTREPTCPKG
jgi:epoxyqueuosine reductase